MDNANLQHLPVGLHNTRAAPPTDAADAMSFHANNPSSFQSFPATIGDFDQRIINAASSFNRPPSLENHHGSLTGRRHLPHQHHPQMAQQPMQQLPWGNNEEAQIQLAIARSHGQMQALRSLVSPEQSTSNGRASGSHTFAAPNDPLEPLSSLQQDKHTQNSTPHSNSNDSEAINKPTTSGHFGGMKLVPHPPDLQAWRERLFNVDDTITLTEEEFNVYFPHVDNVYSHRSTQKYKRKPFISHYWDCRLKGRPPGTPKSDDPTKKKRKRMARERDLCDVKIKITEYFPGADVSVIDSDLSTTISSPSRPSSLTKHASPNHGRPQNGHPAAGGGRYFTIQRVNGNGANGKPDGIGGAHRHTLEDSDRVKKSSVQRYLLKEGKTKKNNNPQKSYHTKASGHALATVEKRSKESDLKLYGSCFCPFVQRVWIALEAKGIPYQYIEIDPYAKPESLLKINPRGLVPAIQHGNWGCYESNVLLEYLEDLADGTPMLPPGDPKLRAHSRLWADHINRHIIPGFYRVLQEQDTQKQVSYIEELRDEIHKLVNASHVHGPFFLGPSISFVDVQIAPWVIRLRRVLKPYRGWPEPEVGSRWASWVRAIEDNEHVKATTSEDKLYMDSYERYADNRPNTSQLANAINSGRGLP